MEALGMETATGLVLFDVCSGRGITAVLLSFWFPWARIVMLDSNGAMDLQHVRKV
jgi:ubiquinone/menaquinone biosynthesis C-methylase UbiE